MPSVWNKDTEDVKTPQRMCLHQQTWIKAVEHHKTTYLVSVIAYRLYLVSRVTLRALAESCENLHSEHNRSRRNVSVNRSGQNLTNIWCETVITWSAYGLCNSNLQPTDTHFYRRQQWLDRSLIKQHLIMLCFVTKLQREAFFFCRHNIVTQGVCNPTV
jgi:hypothetical protein